MWPKDKTSERAETDGQIPTKPTTLKIALSVLSHVTAAQTKPRNTAIAVEGQSTEVLLMAALLFCYDGKKC